MLFVGARDRKGGVSPFHRVELPIRIPSDEIETATADGFAACPLVLHMKRGSHRIAIGARDVIAQIDSTLNTELFVGEQPNQM